MNWEDLNNLLLEVTYDPHDEFSSEKILSGYEIKAIRDVLWPYIETSVRQTIRQEKIKLIGFCKRRAEENRETSTRIKWMAKQSGRRIDDSEHLRFAVCWDAVAKELETADIGLDALYQFEAGQKDGFDTGLDEAAKIIDTFLKDNSLENEVDFADLFEKLKGAKHGD